MTRRPTALSALVLLAALPCAPLGAVPFIRGDADASGRLDIADPVDELNVKDARIDTVTFTPVGWFSDLDREWFRELARRNGGTDEPPMNHR